MNRGPMVLLGGASSTKDDTAKVYIGDGEPREAPSSVHLLPCNIALDGPAKVSTYFLPVQHAASGAWEASFRGKLLTGHVASLPTGTVGLIVSEAPRAPMLPPTVTTARSAVTGVAASTSAPSATTAALPEGEAPMPSPAAPAAGSTGAAKPASRFGSRARQAAAAAAPASTEDAATEPVAAVAAGSSAQGLSAVVAAAAAPVPSAAPPAPCVLPTRALAVHDSFRTAMYWHHDKPVSDADLFKVVADWVAVANALHGDDE